MTLRDLQAKLKDLPENLLDSEIRVIDELFDFDNPSRWTPIQQEWELQSCERIVLTDDGIELRGAK